MISELFFKEYSPSSPNMHKSNKSLPLFFCMKQSILSFSLKSKKKSKVFIVTSEGKSEFVSYAINFSFSP